MSNQAEQLDEWRCPGCHQLLFLFSLSPGAGRIEIWCRHCKALQVLVIPGSTMVDQLADRVVQAIHRSYLLQPRT